MRPSAEPWPCRSIVIILKESFARSLYRDGSHEFLTSDLVVETLATDPKRGNIHLFACLVNHASVAWILWLTGCLWVTTPASIVQKLTSVRVTTVQVHDVAWKSQSACPCIRNYGCIQRGGGRRHERSHEITVYISYMQIQFKLVVYIYIFIWLHSKTNPDNTTQNKNKQHKNTHQTKQYIKKTKQRK